MKAFILALWLSVFPVVHTANAMSAAITTANTIPTATAGLSPEKQGDGFYAMRNMIMPADKAIANINSAIDAYKIALESGSIKPVILVKYIDACDFKNRYLIKIQIQKITAYEALIKRFEPLGKNFSGKKEYNYVMAILWGRRGEITQNITDNSNKNVAEKIKFYGEALYKIDKSYKGYFACKLLGRVHFLSPNIPFVMGWPDKNKSKAYLEEVVKADPKNTEAKFFLADTLWALGDTKTARTMFREVINSVPRKNSRYYDLMSIKECKEKMKILKI